LTPSEINDILESMARNYLTTGETAKLLGCSKQWVSQLARDGTIESYRLQASGWHRIDRASLEEYIEKYSIPVDWDVLNK
jgi:excisionase family DNA binding protein